MRVPIVSLGGESSPILFVPVRGVLWAIPPTHYHAKLCDRGACGALFGGFTTRRELVTCPACGVVS